MVTISKQEPVLARVLSKKARKGVTALLLGCLLGAAPLAWADVTVALTAPPDQSTYTAPANITLEATADATQGFKVQKVEFFYNSTNLIGTATSSPYSVDWTNVQAGAYVLTAKATAAKKNQPDQTATSSPVNITVNAPNMPPAVSLTSPTEGATYNAPATITLTASASDPDGSVVKVEFFHGGTNLIATVTTPPYTFNWTNVEAGAYALTARATDNLNATTTSTPVNVTVNATAALYFIHPDHLNTPRAITNGTGQLVWAWANDDPFGADVPNENPSGLGNFNCNLRLPGQYFDQETNNHYNYFRDYDPGIGRYIQSDPIGMSGGINTYNYVTANPLSLGDPTGLQLCTYDPEDFNSTGCVLLRKTYNDRDLLTTRPDPDIILGSVTVPLPQFGISGTVPNRSMLPVRPSVGRTTAYGQIQVGFYDVQRTYRQTALFIEEEWECGGMCGSSPIKRHISCYGAWMPTKLIQRGGFGFRFYQGALR